MNTHSRKRNASSSRIGEVHHSTSFVDNYETSFEEKFATMLNH